MKLNLDKNKINLIIVIFISILVVISFIFSFRKCIAVNNLSYSQSVIQKDVLSFLNEHKPVRKLNQERVDIKAEAAYSVLVDKKGKSPKILFEKNKNEELPIASLTKLMTAWVGLNKLSLNSKITFTQGDIKTPGEEGYFQPGEKFFFKDLIYSLLGESSNDAAAAIARSGGQDFISAMNSEALRLGLNRTHFINPTGLDESNGEFNYSTASNLSDFMIFLLRTPKASPIVRAIETKKYKLFTSEGGFHHLVINTDKLLGFKDEVIGGKTGYTFAARGCLLILLKAPRDNGYIINVILNSPHRFKEMEKLTDWLKEAYIW